MTRDEMEAIGAKYELVFGYALSGPPLDFGHIDIDLDDLFLLAKTAIERGKPIDWSEIYKPLPEGALS